MGEHGGQFDVSVMIGYLQQGSASEWHHSVNGWIADLVEGKRLDDCVWKRHEKLELIEENSKNRLARYISVHERNVVGAEVKIALHHLWIVMT